MSDNSKEFTITKEYSKTVSKDYNSWKFATRLTRTVEANSPDELISESDKLFNQAKGLTEMDIDSVKHEWEK